MIKYISFYLTVLLFKLLQVTESTIDALRLVIANFYLNDI